MARSGAMMENRKALRRIMMLLLTLAGLAEYACGRSRFVRWLVLWILGPVEAVARDYLAGLAGVPVPGLPGQTPDNRDGGVAEAARLAFVFRALAAALAALLDERAVEPAAPGIGMLTPFRVLRVLLPVAFCDSS